MATTNDTPKPIATTDASTEETFLTPQRIRVLGIAAAAILIVALVAWFVVTSGRRKDAYATTALEHLSKHVCFPCEVRGAFSSPPN